jgi:dUTP pyrophosphatase
MIKVKFIKKINNAQLPTSKHFGDAGYDLFSVENVQIPAKGAALVPTGIDVAYIQEGYWFSIAPRSGLGFKSGLQPHLGTIDQGYRGGLEVKMYNFSDKDYNIKEGDRIAQIIFYPLVKADITFTETKSETDRNENGFGSTGN